MEIIWHGTASVELRSGNDRLLFDPFVPLKGADRQIPIEAYDGFHDILVTHGYFDHIVNLPEIVRRNPLVTVHCTETPCRTLMSKDVPEKNLSPIHYSQHLQFGAFSVDVYHGRHAVLPNASVRRVASIIFSKNIRNLPFIARENKICVENDETVLYAVHEEEKTVTVCGSLNLR